MSRGKYLSLEEARKASQIDQFGKEHPSEGDGDRFAKCPSGDFMSRMNRLSGGPS